MASARGGNHHYRVVELLEKFKTRAGGCAGRGRDRRVEPQMVVTVRVGFPDTASSALVIVPSGIDRAWFHIGDDGGCISAGTHEANSPFGQRVVRDLVGEVEEERQCKCYNCLSNVDEKHSKIFEDFARELN